MKSPYYDALNRQIAALGGMHNAHLHLDRANTLADGFVDHGRVQVLESSHLSLQKKHALIRTIHDGPAYDSDSLNARVRDTLEIMIACGTRRADTVVDVTNDRVQTHALEQLMAIGRDMSDRIELQAAAYTPMGFSDADPGRWEVFERGAAISDFLGSLPEADDQTDYPDHIGFDEHIARMLDVARRTGKMLHIHLDQINSAGEDGTERMLAVMRRETGPLSMPDGSPQVWAIHVISPTCYDDARWDALVAGLLEMNVGVISCPSGALGMRQLRAVQTFTGNSIARVLELAAAGVQIRLGSDNIADMCSPSTTANMIEEVFALTSAVRYYKIEIMAKFAAGLPLSTEERASIQEHLDRNDEEVARLIQRFGPR